MPSTTPRRFLSVLSMLAAVLVSSAPAIANPPNDPPNHDEPYLDGTYGVHILIDGGEPYPGVTCHYTAGHLDQLSIRRPIALGTSVDQEMGWRYQVEGTNESDLYGATWTPVFVSTIERVHAVDRQVAPFLPKVHSLSNPNFDNYRVVDKMFWFDGGSIVGRAFLAVETYARSPGPGTSSNGCPGTFPPPPVSPAGPPNNPDVKYLWGTYGVNLLIDENEPTSFSGAACTYNQSSVLTAIRSRRPIAFPAGHAQYMAWRFIIEGTNSSHPTGSNWNQVAMTPLEKVWAPDPLQPAPFTPKTLAVPGTASYDLYRVVDKVFWYDPSNTIAGKSFMAVESYDDSPLDPQGYELGCPRQLQ